jgi:serine/threonine-protein phosphatase 4 catalytic subunit
MACSDLDRQIAVLMNCDLISEAEVRDLCSKAREILFEESNVQRVDPPVTVRLQFWDLSQSDFSM